MDQAKLTQWVEEMKLRQVQLDKDPHRPAYHFLPPANWMNDPNGLIQWKGMYHAFYQHNPNGAFWGTMHWGHARSRDLIHWEHLPIALAPDMPYDKDGIFSGCCVDHHGVPAILYTGVRPQVQCMATSDDEMIRWTKHPANPVIPTPPPGYPIDNFRDPCVWKEGKDWLMAVGSANEADDGAVLLYRSTDLVNWEYLHPLLQGSRDMPAPAGTACMWECPSFFPLGDRHVLILSCIPRDKNRPPAPPVAYLVGDYRDRRFHPERFETLDLGSDYYAPATMTDEKGRRLMFGWVGCWRNQEWQASSGWAGALSLPDMLTLRPDGRVRIEPVPETQLLRRRRLEPNGIHGDLLEIDATFAVEGSKSVGLRLRATPDGTEETLVTYDPVRRVLELNRDRASLNPSARRGVCGGLVTLAPGEPLRLRVFVDRCLIEVYANERARLTSAVFPSRPDSLEAGPLPNSGRLVSINAWEMASIWERHALEENEHPLSCTFQ